MEDFFFLRKVYALIYKSENDIQRNPNKSRLILLFQEMAVPLTPLTAIAQTPRKEPESKFTFNPHLVKVRIDLPTRRN